LLRAAVLRGVAEKDIVGPSVDDELRERLHAEAREIEKAHRVIPANSNELPSGNLRAGEDDLRGIADAIMPT
jgi:hypothetical protein